VNVHNQSSSLASGVCNYPDGANKHSFDVKLAVNILKKSLVFHKNALSNDGIFLWIQPEERVNDVGIGKGGNMDGSI
jgi:hypothetical protein